MRSASDQVFVLNVFCEIFLWHWHLQPLLEGRYLTFVENVEIRFLNCASFNHVLALKMFMFSWSSIVPQFMEMWHLPVVSQIYERYANGPIDNNVKMFVCRRPLNYTFQICHYLSKFLNFFGDLSLINQECDLSRDTKIIKMRNGIKHRLFSINPIYLYW